MPPCADPRIHLELHVTGGLCLLWTSRARLLLPLTAGAVHQEEACRGGLTPTQPHIPSNNLLFPHPTCSVTCHCTWCLHMELSEHARFDGMHPLKACASHKLSELQPWASNNCFLEEAMAGQNDLAGQMWPAGHILSTLKGSASRAEGLAFSLFGLPKCVSPQLLIVLLLNCKPAPAPVSAWEETF